MAASSADSNISLSDITECSICLETWKDPRSLPVCDHTFCLQCLKTFVQTLDEDSEDTRCPVCRKQFAIPEGGFDFLPKNFMHQQLLDARRASENKISSLEEDANEKDAKISSLETQLEHAEEKLRKLNEAKESVRSTLFLSKSTVVCVIPGASYVYGIAVLGSELFIARDGRTSVEVYHTNNITAISRLLKISDETLNCPQLAACSHYNCLYVSHWRDAGPVMYRAELSNSSVSRWEATVQCGPLTLTNNHTVLVAMYHRGLLELSNKVREYATQGELIREIRLDRSIDNPCHCIQLSDSNFVISHRGSKQHRVCIVDASGRIIKSYGGAPRSGVYQLNGPYQLSVDKYDHVFVADRGNNRVQLLSPALTLLGTVQIPGHQLDSPDALHFDKISHRLYIEGGSGCVLVVELSIPEM